MTDLCTRITDYIWYTAPHSDKFHKYSAAIPPFFEPLIPFYNPKRHNHTAKQLQKAILLHYLDGILTLMEKLFTNRASFAVIKTKIESHFIRCYILWPSWKLLSICIIVPKYCWRTCLWKHRKNPSASVTIKCYKNKSERKAILDIEEKLSELDCYEPICLDEYFPLNWAQKYFRKTCTGKWPHY